MACIYMRMHMHGGWGCAEDLKLVDQLQVDGSLQLILVKATDRENCDIYIDRDDDHIEMIKKGCRSHFI